jgi:hypothetical protein
MSRWLREPLLHFALLGALIFIGYGLVGDTEGDSESRIVVTVAQQQNLAQTFARTWQRPPTRNELDSLIQDFIRQELAYRQAQAMGLDRDDIVVRRRMRQKIEMFAEDVVEASPPTTEELATYYSEHAEDYRAPALYTFRQIYFSTDVDPRAAEQAANDLLARLREDETAVSLATAGDRSLLPAELENASTPLVAARFGADFAASLDDIEPDRWDGPVRSGFGLHVVRVDARQESLNPDLDEVRSAVTRDWFAVRRRDALEAFYDDMAANYEIVIAPVEAESGEVTP